ncbi:MAG: DUF2844 domain-containing protein [Terriglobia bacterium]
MKSGRVWRTTGFACLLLLLFATPIWAVLGQPVSSVQADRARMRGKSHAVAEEGYSIQTITTAYGEVVSEYVSPAGMVFGVSWKGPAMPKLSQLLGSYFSQLNQPSRANVRRRRSVTVRTQQVIIQSGGHPRGFYGRAYVPSLVPAHISPSVVH